MTNSGGHRRRYGDKEVGLILKRAAELQRQEPAAAAEGGGLSLAELEEIGAEAGIDPRLLRRAAEELEASGAAFAGEGAARALGAPIAIKYERVLSGEFPESEFERLVPEIQRAADGLGQAGVLGRTLTWQSTSRNNERTLHVSISSRDGKTRILIEERLGQMAGQLFGGLMGGLGGGMGLGVGLGVGIGALGSAVFAVAWPIGAITGSYLLARSIYRTSVRRRQRALRDLLDRLTEEVENMNEGRALEDHRGTAELSSG
jgi:hypothetical protein